MHRAPILVISGTNRPQANGLKIARIVQACYHLAEVPVDLLSLAELPPDIFNPEAYASKPAAFGPFQQRVVQARGLHLVVPEYNGSFPGVLKYFIDMLKFPESLEGKPVALVGEANGRWGALRAVEQLQAILAYRNAHVFPWHVLIPGVGQKLDAEGHLTDAELNRRLEEQTRGFARFVQQLVG